MQRDELHAVNDVLRVAKRVPLAGFDVWRCDALRSLKKRLYIFRCLRGDFRRQPKVVFWLGNVDLGIWKTISPS
jgi:hypothetical protein